MAEHVWIELDSGSVCHYEFTTPAELNAFLKGLREAAASCSPFIFTQHDKDPRKTGPEATRGLAREVIEYAFTIPTAGDALDVPCGFVPWTMGELEEEAVRILRDEDRPAQVIEEAVPIVRDYFARCRGEKA